MDAGAEHSPGSANGVAVQVQEQEGEERQWERRPRRADGIAGGVPDVAITGGSVPDLAVTFGSVRDVAVTSGGNGMSTTRPFRLLAVCGAVAGNIGVFAAERLIQSLVHQHSRHEKRSEQA